MIRLISSNLSQVSTAYLQNVQARINAAGTFQAECERAKAEWASKTSSQAAKTAFADVKQKLKDMCSGTSICVYCEHNEATDIEHIYPKRLFPGRAFTWSNYVFACGNCNSHYKKDNFKVFSPANGIVSVDVTPTDYTVYTQPPTDDAVFIDQRVEDPMHFLELDFVQQSFYYMAKYNEGTREFEKADYTKHVLGLNYRADLVEQRKAAFVFYKEQLNRYVNVLRAANMDELINCVDGVTDVVDTVSTFANEQERLKTIISTRIKKHSHRTVWKEMIRQREQLPTTLLLFNQAPEAINW